MKQAALDPELATRERLLDAAERLFAGRGFAGTSVRDITDKANANLGAVNYYFRSKEGLYAGVFTRRVALLRDPVVSAAREAAGLARRNPEEALRVLGRAFLDPHANRGPVQCLMELFARETIEACLPPGLLQRGVLAPPLGPVARRS